jgi:hypothetical protein
MKRSIAMFVSALLLGLAAPAGAQSEPKRSAAEQELRERAIERCKENRGSDCTSEAGLREWVRQERTLTPEQQQHAAALRQKRERCAKNPKGTGC